MHVCMRVVIHALPLMRACSSEEKVHGACMYHYDYVPPTMYVCMHVPAGMYVCMYVCMYVRLCVHARTCSSDEK